MGKIRVLIADDHSIVREGLHVILDGQPDIEVVGEAREGRETVAKTLKLKPDVVMMDITMPGMSGLEAARQIKHQVPEVRILVLTMHENNEYFFQMIHAGASGYFVKGGSANELLSAVRAVSQGNVYLYPSMAKKLLSDYLERVGNEHDQEQHDGLTDREREVLTLIAEGHSNQEIADVLKLGVSTVQSHRARIMAKLGLHSRTELVKYAIRRGFIILES
ncbi:MAG: response regulator transcription factor [Bacteroidetes bacterium]|nr:response regulator transcription factor [Bacteroidota bacterium]MCL5024930.1 response regulator transcription factor [Chloroflexota bacterium]